jgi:hypothetical protein
VTPFREGNWEVNPAKFAALVEISMQTYGWDKAQAEAYVNKTFEDRVFRNDTYQVAMRQFSNKGFGGEWVHLSVRRVDREPIHDWRDLQEIKNQLVGAENEGVELYPAESRRVDTSNQYHLFILKDPELRLPIGFTDRLVMEQDQLRSDITEAKQRPVR